MDNNDHATKTVHVLRRCTLLYSVCGATIHGTSQLLLESCSHRVLTDARDVGKLPWCPRKKCTKPLFYCSEIFFHVLPNVNRLTARIDHWLNRLHIHFKNDCGPHDPPYLSGSTRCRIYRNFCFEKKPSSRVLLRYTSPRVSPSHRRYEQNNTWMYR